MRDNQKLRIWPYYVAALFAMAFGVPILLSGLWTTTPASLEKVTGRVASLSWIDVEGENDQLSVILTLDDATPTYILKTLDATQRAIYAQLPNRRVALWTELDAAQVQPLVTYRLETDSSAYEAVDLPIISYDHIGNERVAAGRLRWGALLIVVAAVFVVIARLVDVWNRHRDEITGR